MVKTPVTKFKFIRKITDLHICRVGLLEFLSHQ